MEFEEYNASVRNEAENPEPSRIPAAGISLAELHGLTKIR
jgi:hypothetical protein